MFEIIVKFFFGLVKLFGAILGIIAVLFLIVIIGELVHCNGGSSTPDNAVHWRP